LPISPLEGEMSGRTEGGAKERDASCTPHHQSPPCPSVTPRSSPTMTAARSSVPSANLKARPMCATVVSSRSRPMTTNRPM
ncbi:MAG: hypothetical protein E5X51_34395, partial [Mesorhizobium sp.]